MSRLPYLLSCFLLMGSHIFADSGASVVGTVQLPKGRATPVMAKRYEIVTKGGVLSTNPPVAVVYLEGKFPGQGAPQVKQIIQKDFVFNPALLVIQTGTKVEFPNLDNTYHNVFSYSPAKRFDLGRYLADEKPVPSQTFDKAGMVTLRCDIHEHMRGIILVLDTPHHTVSSPDGAYALKGLPAGDYTLKAWINSRTTFEKPVQLKTGTTFKIDFP